MTPTSSIMPRILYESILTDLKSIIEALFYDNHYWDELSAGNVYEFTITEMIRETGDTIILHHARIYSEEVPDSKDKL